VKLLPIEERSKHSCFFCGTSKSVKYIVELPENKQRDIHSVYCCNLCALKNEGGNTNEK